MIIPRFFLRIDKSPLSADLVHDLHYLDTICQRHGITFQLSCPYSFYTFLYFIFISADLIRDIRLLYEPVFQIIDRNTLRIINVFYNDIPCFPVKNAFPV